MKCGAHAYAAVTTATATTTTSTTDFVFYNSVSLQKYLRMPPLHFLCGGIAVCVTHSCFLGMT